MTDRRLLLLNGPNLNLELVSATAELGLAIRAVQNNHEGVPIDAIHEAKGDCVGIVINPGAYSHTSVAIADALSAIELPVAEVHLRNIHPREAFRHHSYVSAVAQIVVAGAGPLGYEMAVRHLASELS